MKRLPTGYDVKFNTPCQLKEIGAFLHLQLQQIAAGLGLPDHLLSSDLSSANYSSLHAGLLPFRQRLEQIQYGVLTQIWPRLITRQPKPMQVDRLKDTQATVALDAGLTSRRKAVAERGWGLEDLASENRCRPALDCQGVQR